MDKRLEEALRHFDPRPGVKLWHGGATVLGALRGVTPGIAEWQPYPEKHSIWELALHIAYWNYAVKRRLTNEPTGGFPRSPADWPDLPKERTTTTWNTDRQLIKDSHNQLAESIQSFDSSKLDEKAGDSSSTTYADLITGIVLHDTYHVGQIQLLKRLARSREL